MSELTVMRRILGRLRKWVRATREDGFGPMGTDLETLRDIADVLEAEISELEDDLNTAELDNEYLREQLRHIEQLERESAYMRLPVDADGVPIHVGDFLETSEYNGRRFHCNGFCYETALVGQRWTIAMSYDNETGTTEFVSAHSCRHVQQDALESLLCDMIHEYGSTDALTETVAEKYAERIRKAVEHDRD